MTWDAVGAVAEILGALAVIVTLFYLAKQIKHSAVASTKTHLQMLQDSLDDWMMSLAKDSNLAEIHRKGLLIPDSLTESEKTQFRWLMHTFFAKAEIVYLQATSETTSIRGSENWTRILGEILSTDGGAQIWDQISHTFEPKFVDYVKGIRTDHAST